MRLFRGLKRSYRPERVSRWGTDFTDCPFTALQYAQGRYGVLLVLDVPEDADEARISEEDWFDEQARRLMVWGAFDAWISAIIPAKEARAVVRAKGIRGASRERKAAVLRQAIDRYLSADPPRSPLVEHTDPVAWGQWT